jgi:S-DNA-T family DNA segregation ATPase FtsK/SpoIIIE
VVDSRESKSIIDRTGAEKLLGYGDMLYSATDSSLPIHAQAAYVSYEEVDAIIDYFKI